MSNRNQRREAERRGKNNKRSKKEVRKDFITSIIFIVLLIVVLGVILFMIFYPVVKESKRNNTAINNSQTFVADENTVRVPVSSLQQGIATLFDYDIEGGPIQFIVTLNNSGFPVAAINTSEACAGNPYAFYVQVDSEHIVCQNCGQIRHVSEIGNVFEECYPIPLFTVSSEGYGLIDDEEISQYLPLFENWQVGIDTKGELRFGVESLSEHYQSENLQEDEHVHTLEDGSIVYD